MSDAAEWGERPKVLVVDDNATNIEILVTALRAEYDLGVAKNGNTAIQYAERERPQLILLDVMMPDMDGFEVCEQLKDRAATADIPVIFITAMHEPEQKSRGFEVGAVDYIIKPFHAGEVQARVRAHLGLRRLQLELSDQNQRLQERVDEQTAEIRSVLEATIRAMATMAESRDPYTAGHQQRVSRLAVSLGQKLSLTSAELKLIESAGLLHDIGKIRIPVSILNRPGKILAPEFELIKIHPTVGFDLLREFPSFAQVAQVVHQHHEKLDGSGYPLGIAGPDIHPLARVLTVADVMEAMSSFRPYRPAWGNDVALRSLQGGAGTVFDADAVEACRCLYQSDCFSLDRS